MFEQKNGVYWEGLSDNYIRVLVKSKEYLSNQLKETKVKKFSEKGFLGQLVD